MCFCTCEVFMTREHCSVSGMVIGKERHLSVPPGMQAACPSWPVQAPGGLPPGLPCGPRTSPRLLSVLLPAVLLSRWAALFSGRDNTSRCSDGLKLCYSHFDFYKCCLLHLNTVFAIPVTLYYTLYSIY